MSHLHIAIPAMDELDFLPRTLQAIANQQTAYPFTVYICVNQPENYWENPEKVPICHHNQQLLVLLKREQRFKINLIDCTSKGKGWTGKNYGVGWARKKLFDTILETAAQEDMIISLDSDTLFGPSYFQSVGDQLTAYPFFSAISVPYYHDLTENDRENRAILRYEIYMRSWVLNLYRINSPYNFTAVGSAIAMKVNALRKIGSITPMKSGEDFYLLQKLRKMTVISNWNEETVHPEARFSDRVFFGTGPAMIKGDGGHWESYPIYHYSLFDEIEQTYCLIKQLYKEDIETPFIQFLQSQFKTDRLWKPLRENAKEVTRFERAFHEKADGLRILQYLKYKQKALALSDEQALYENIKLLFPCQIPLFLTPFFAFDDLSTLQLNEIRDLLFNREMLLRKEAFNQMVFC
ncbi:MAG: hypothetical protein RR356_00230 [Bacteroidales bacterium]